MSDRVRITKAYLDFIMDALKFATPQIHLPVQGEEAAAEAEPSNEEKIEDIRKKLFENDGTVSLDERDFGFIYDAVQNYKNYLNKELPKHKKGSAGYNKTKKALDMIPKINATFFSTMVF
jgi:hypothetical protein